MSILNQHVKGKSAQSEKNNKYNNNNIEDADFEDIE